jgi:G:T-mismatch repair DNA endonuclease (very short patch repair protein)
MTVWECDTRYQSRLERRLRKFVEGTT